MPIVRKEMRQKHWAMETISVDFKEVEESHGKNVLNLVVVVGYLKTLLDNARVVKFLAAEYPELLSEFRKTAESRTLTEMPGEV